MRVPRIRLRTLMIGIAFLALILTVIMQSVLLQRAAVREQKSLAMERQHRAMAEAALRKALVAEQQARATLDQMSKAGQK